VINLYHITAFSSKSMTQSASVFSAFCWYNFTHRVRDAYCYSESL